MMDAVLPEHAAGCGSTATRSTRSRASRPAGLTTLGADASTQLLDGRRRGGRVSAATDRLAAARAVADAVLYEGYLLYPYRASPEEPVALAVRRARAAAAPRRPRARRASRTMRTECLLRRRAPAPRSTSASASCSCRTARSGQRADDADVRAGRRADVDGDRAGSPGTRPSSTSSTLGRVRAGRRRRTARPGRRGSPAARTSRSCATATGGWSAGVRRREPLAAASRGGRRARGDGPTAPCGCGSRSRRQPSTADRRGRREATPRAPSLLGAHLLVEVARRARSSRCSTRRPGAAAPPRLRAATAAGRCWPATTATTTSCWSSPIILYDHPAVAPESAGDLFDATEIDEILTLRVHDP